MPLGRNLEIRESGEGIILGISYTDKTINTYGATLFKVAALRDDGIYAVDENGVRRIAEGAFDGVAASPSEVYAVAVKGGKSVLKVFDWEGSEKTSVVLPFQVHGIYWYGELFLADEKRLYVVRDGEAVKFADGGKLEEELGDGRIIGLFGSGSFIGAVSSNFKSVKKAVSSLVDIIWIPVPDSICEKLEEEIAKEEEEWEEAHKTEEEKRQEELDKLFEEADEVIVMDYDEYMLGRKRDPYELTREIEEELFGDEEDVFDGMLK